MEITTRPAAAPVLQRAFVPVIDLELRGAGNGDGLILEGHAAVIGQETTLYEGRTFRVVERIEPGFFDDVLAANPDVHLNVGHDMNLVMARTGRSANTVGGLELAVDDVGLRFFARVNPNLTYVRDLQIAMGDGLIDQASFAFTVAADEVTTTTDENGYETDTRKLKVCRNLYDVCVCAQGAYPQTDASIRSLMAAVGRTPDGAGRDPDRRTPEAAGDPSSSVAAQPGAGPDAARRAQLIARAKVAKHQHRRNP